GDGESSWPALDSSGNIYVADQFSNRVVKLNSTGGTVAVFTDADGVPFNGPTAVAVDAAGNLFLVDEGNGRILEYAP
ncbi:MAG TPA: 6-bladed beta-propeller, partial [bacterium]|nr:6-bladed beta-propeller [bacterium]